MGSTAKPTIMTTNFLTGVFLALVFSVAASAQQRDSAGVRGVRIESFQRTVTESVAWMKITVTSDTPTEHTWSVLRNVADWERFMKLFSKSDVVEHEGEKTVVRFAVSPPWPLSGFSCLVETKENSGTRVIDWNVQEGKLRGNYGSVSVENIDGGSRIIYESNGPAKNAFPNWAVKIGTYIVLPGVLKDIYNRICQERDSKPH